MESVQETEIQLAQRLASNERTTRTKAMQKLRKYIQVRSATGGFVGDEVLKLWKGLFYCLWQQDKPLLQEELSKQISSLIHHFHNIDGQLLYLESFLQTVKREWTGIDGLRMDKFFQLVRFMFRQTFEVLKKKDWASSDVEEFLRVLTAQLLQSDSAAPCGLTLHILDLYMTELAAVGSAQLTADQNWIFIEPFCKTAARTKDQILFGAICNSILSTIIDQAPFAIEELLAEVDAGAASDTDSGQASEEDSDPGPPQDSTPKAVSKKHTKADITDEDDEDEDEDDDLDLDDSDRPLPCDEDVGPVLQFDYGALADKLFVMASRKSTPGQNRRRLYKTIKVLRDLSEGVFLQDEGPEEVSTDEDDEMFGSRKRMKRKGDLEEGPTAKKTKGKKKKKKESTPDQQDKDSVKEEDDLKANNENKKKKKRRKKNKKKGQGETVSGQENSEQKSVQAQSAEEVDEGLGGSQDQHVEKEVTKQVCASAGEEQEATAPKGQPETPPPSEEKKNPAATVIEITDEPTPCSTDCKDQEQHSPVKQPTPQTDAKGSSNESPEAESKGQQEADVQIVSSEATTPAKKKRKKKEPKPAKSPQDPQPHVNGVSTEADSPIILIEDSVEKNSTQPELEIIDLVGEDTEEVSSKLPVKKSKKNKGKPEIITVEDVPAADESPVGQEKKKGKKNKSKSKVLEEEEAAAVVESPLAADPGTTTTDTPVKKKKKTGKQAENKEEEVVQPQGTPSADEEPPLKESDSGKKVKKRKKIPIEFEYEADEVEAASINGLAEKQTVAKKTKLSTDVGELSTPQSAKKSKKKAKTAAGSEQDFITFPSQAAVPTPLYCKTKRGLSTPQSSKKTSQSPKSESKKVTFGLKNNKTAEFKKNDRSLLLSPVGSSRVAFDPNQTPKCGVLKSRPKPHAASAKKISVNTATSSNTPKKTPKKRPSASDFF